MNIYFRLGLRGAGSKVWDNLSLASRDGDTTIVFGSILIVVAIVNNDAAL